MYSVRQRMGGREEIGFKKKTKEDKRIVSTKRKLKTIPIVAENLTQLIVKGSRSTIPVHYTESLLLKREKKIKDSP